LGASTENNGVAAYSVDVDAVLARALGAGVGVAARGGRANVNLTPLAFSGLPTTGAYSRGDLYVDANGVLFLCVAAGDFATSTHPVIVRVGFNPLNPTRVCDTRAGTGPGGGFQPNPLNVYAGQTMAPFSDLTIAISGPIGPTGSQQTIVPPQASAVVLNVTVVNFTAPGNFTVYPADLASPPTAANLNWPGPQSDGLVAIGNSVTVKVGANGVKIHNASSGSTDVVVDIGGFFS
jgi:hypothetical protein